MLQHQALNLGIKVMAKSREARRHGQYYELSKEGKRIAKRIKKASKKNIAKGYQLIWTMLYFH